MSSDNKDELRHCDYYSRPRAPCVSLYLRGLSIASIPDSYDLVVCMRLGEAHYSRAVHCMFLVLRLQMAKASAKSEPEEDFAIAPVHDHGLAVQHLCVILMARELQMSNTSQRKRKRHTCNKTSLCFTVHCTGERLQASLACLEEPAGTQLNLKLLHECPGEAPKSRPQISCARWRAAG